MSDRQYVVIRDMSAGNESVGEMWQETKIFDGSATLEDVMKWANWNGVRGDEPHKRHTMKRITLTRAHTETPNE